MVLCRGALIVVFAAQLNVIQMEIKQLISEIDTFLPPIKRPKEIYNSESRGQDFEDFKKYLDQYQEDELPSEVIESIYNDLVYLSSSGWRWVMPYYLKQCLKKATQSYNSSSEYLANNSETEFLIYNLYPSEEFEDHKTKWFKDFSEQQLLCFVHFLEWCGQYPHLKSFWSKDIPKGIELINKCITRRSS